MSDVAKSDVIYGAKRALGETKAMVLLLHRQGKTVRQIATTTEISTQAVRDHLARARANGELGEDE